MDYSMPGLLSFTNSHSLLKLMSIKSVMPSNHLILCYPLLLLPPIFPSIRIFSFFYCKKKKKWNVFYFFLNQKSKITHTWGFMCMNLLMFMFLWCIKIKGGGASFQAPGWGLATSFGAQLALGSLPSPRENPGWGPQPSSLLKGSNESLTLQLFTCGICQSSLETRGQVFKSQDDDIFIKLKKKLISLCKTNS